MKRGLPNPMPKRAGRSSYQRYSAEYTPEERKLLFKLDLLIIPYAFLGYWIKYLDQTNLSEFLGCYLEHPFCKSCQCILDHLTIS